MTTHRDSPTRETTQIQGEHYDRILAEYDRHYGDTASRAYRDRFFHDFFFADRDISGWRVLDAMCGSGETTRYLLERQAQVTGIDVSTVAITTYRAAFPTCQAVCAPIKRSGLPAGSFDAVVSIGGLHHLHPELEQGIDEMLRLLRPGGLLCFADPVAGSLFDVARRLWYRLDPLFNENESAIDVPRLQASYRDRLQFDRTDYGGNVAYLLVLNSMIFRMPPRLKPLYSPSLMALERVLQRLQPRPLALCVRARWIKR